MTPEIQLYGGGYFSFVDLQPVPIEVLAHALCRVNRFVGHTSGQLGYSVAQHSLNVMAMLPPHLQLQGLMHDAHEALVGDVSAPLKMLLPDYQRLEARVETFMRESFGLPAQFDPLVRKADLWMLHVESTCLQVNPISPPSDTEGIDLSAPLYLKPRRLASLKGQFLYHFHRLTRRADDVRNTVEAAGGEA